MYNKINQCLGQLIKLQRKIHNLPIKVISEKTKTPISHIYKYESNKMKIPSRFLYQFSQYINIKVDFFYNSYEQKPDFDYKKDVDKDTLKFLQSFVKIKDTKQKQVFFERVQDLILNRECYL
jgi:transcriptional regulator with XRE-family HTH domain